MEKEIKLFKISLLEKTTDTDYGETIKEEVGVFSLSSASFDICKNFMERGEKLVNRTIAN